MTSSSPRPSADDRLHTRRMNAHQVRSSLAFTHCSATSQSIAWWGVTKWVRKHRSIHPLLEISEGKKASPPKNYCHNR